MKRKLWIRIGAVVLAALLLWWLFWAILIDEDENDQGLPETEQIGQWINSLPFLILFQKYSVYSLIDY